MWEWKTPDDAQAPALGVPVGPQVALGVDRVDPGRARRRWRWDSSGRGVLATCPPSRPHASSGSPSQQWATISAYDLASDTQHRWGERSRYRGRPMPKGPTRRASAQPKDDGRKIVAQNRRARHDYDILDTVEAGHRARGLRGQVPPRGQGPAQGRLRPGRRRRDVAVRGAHPARTSTPPASAPTIPSAGAGCCSTAARSSSLHNRVAQDGPHPDPAVALLQGRAGQGRAGAWPRAGTPTTSATPSPSATPGGMSSGR